MRADFKSILLNKGLYFLTERKRHTCTTVDDAVNLILCGCRGDLIRQFVHGNKIKLILAESERECLFSFLFPADNLGKNRIALRIISQNVVDTGDEMGFKLWQNYRMDQVQLKLLKNPANNQVGTYYYDDFVVIFASLKKDLDEADKLNYKDKFLQPDLFQWESMTNLPQSHLDKLVKSSFTHVFIRKVSTENGLVLPFTYVGKGKLQNPRKTEGGNGTYLFDIHMENALPEYLQYDFGLTKE